MKRSSAFVVVIIAVMVVSFWNGSNTEAQDATPDYLATIAALEAKIDKQATSIAKRDEKIDEQRTRIAELKEPSPTPETGCASFEEAEFVAALTKLQDRTTVTTASIVEIMSDPTWVRDADKFLELIDLLDLFHGYYAEGVDLGPPPPRLKVFYDHLIAQLSHMDQASTLIVEGVLADDTSLIIDALDEVELANDSGKEALNVWQTLGPELCFNL